MNLKPYKQFLILLFCVACFTVNGCGPVEWVPIPSAANDRPPLVTIHAIPSGPGTVKPGEATYPTSKNETVYPVNTVVIITVDAKSFGGVKSLTISGHKGDNKLWEVTKTNSPNAQGLVTKSIGILGTDNNQPLLLTFNANFEVAWVEVEATNFNNQKTKFNVGYQATNINPN
jgi:hypothetical protein